MISRSLGPEFGGSIGLIFALANAVGAAMHIIGFAETVRDLMKEHNVGIVDSNLNDIRIIGIAMALLLMIVCFIGTGFESKMQLILLFVLAVSLINYIIGVFLPLKPVQKLRGVTGFSGLFRSYIYSLLKSYDYRIVFNCSHNICYQFFP